MHAGDYSEAAWCAVELGRACDECADSSEGRQLQAAAEQRSSALLQVYVSPLDLHDSAGLAQCHQHLYPELPG